MKALHRSARAFAVALGLLAGAAQAEPILYAFQIGFESGPLTGQKAIGRFTVDGSDCAPSGCSGLFTPNDAAHTLLSFEIVVDGIDFMLGDDAAFGLGFPIFGLTDDRITHIDYNTFTGAFEPWLSISAFGEPLTAFGKYVNADGFASDIGPGSVLQVPEPATMLLVAGAMLAGFSASRRRTSR